jgi:hypothetical protein
MSGDFEKLCSEVAAMGRNEIKTKLLHFRGKLKIDFTETYLDNMTLDKLRHVLLAALSVESRRHA